MRRMKRRFPYEQHNKWSRDAAEKRRWTEALEKSGPKRVIQPRPGFVRLNECRRDQGRRGWLRS